MAESTGIGWTDATFNPWIGCSKVSPGCAHCYAETLVVHGRMNRPGTWGDDGERQRTSVSNWRKPIRWAKNARKGLLPDGSENLDGHRPRVFCASLADVFEPRPELDPWRRDLFDLIDATPELDWQLLTKRPEYASDFLGSMFFSYETWPNVWLGVSIENGRHVYRADVLRAIPAAVRFISAEPLLGSLYGESADRSLKLRGIDWVIVGGESGPGHRPMDRAWARELRVHCELRGTAFFFKQWGGATSKAGGKTLDGREWCEFPPSAVGAA